MKKLINSIFKDLTVILLTWLFFGFLLNLIGFPVEQVTLSASFTLILMIYTISQFASWIVGKLWE